MKKEKMIITSIVATLLLAGLLFYWNNNEVHACEAVSLETAREILSEENVLLEYSGVQDYHTEKYDTMEWIEIYNKFQGIMIICKNGEVYYAGYSYSTTYAYSNSMVLRGDDIWDIKIYETDPTSMYYLGKISTMDIVKIRLKLLFCNHAEMYREEYRYLISLHTPIYDLDSTEGETQTDAMEEIKPATPPNIENETLTFLSQHEDVLVTKFLDMSMYRLCFWSNVEDEMTYLHYKAKEERGILQEQNALDICTKVHESWFFEQYALMALTEMYSLRDPVVEKECRFVLDENVSTDIVSLSSVNSEHYVTVDDKGGLYYCIQGIVYYMSPGRTETRVVLDALCGLDIEKFLTVGNQLVCVSYLWEEMLSIYENDKVKVLIEDYMIGAIHEYAGELYGTNYSSLIRLSLDGTIETLWEHAVYGFTVDENYIYIFDGNTWQVLDRESGEDLGWIATNIHFAYEPGEVYASGGRLFFNAWNPEEQTVSVNSLDMEGNLEQIGETHIAGEYDAECVSGYGEYLFYVTEYGSKLVRVNINSGEETTLSIADYVSYIYDILIIDDCLMVHGGDHNYLRVVACFNLETLEYEGMMSLE